MDIIIAIMALNARISNICEASTCHEPIVIIIIIFLQTWHQSVPGYESFAWDHVVVWSSDAIAQSFHLHFYDPQLYSGELFVTIQTVKPFALHKFSILHISQQTT